MAEIAVDFLPASLTPVGALVLVLASFFASAFTAAFGLGGGVAMLALMAAFLPVSAIIPVHGAVQFGSNVGRAWHQRAFIAWSALWPFLAGALAGAAIGGATVVELPDAILKTILGIFIILVTWMRIPGMEGLSRIGLAAGGMVIAAVSMFLGATGPLAAAFLNQVVAGDRRNLIATHAAAMTVLHGLKIVVFGALGFAFWQWIPLVGAMVATGYLGTVTGTRLLSVLAESTFRFWFRILLTLLALDLIRRGVAALL